MDRHTLAREIPPLLRAFARHPVRVARALPAEWRQRRGASPWTEQDFDPDWDEHLHALIGAPWPCPDQRRVHDLLGEVSRLLTEKGLGTGRHTYGWYSDADIELCTAIWCVARHKAPAVVIETGVAHGISSRVILEALAANGRGHLWSIDLPHPLNRQVHADTGVAVTEPLRPRWTYLEGESQQLLPPLVARSAPVDLFLHDSLHTAQNTLFEMEQAASAMRPGGVLLIDDIRGHDGFKEFARRHPEYKVLRCSTADRLAGFGVAVYDEAAVPSTVTPKMSA